MIVVTGRNSANNKMSPRDFKAASKKNAYWDDAWSIVRGNAIAGSKKVSVLSPSSKDGTGLFEDYLKLARHTGQVAYKGKFYTKWDEKAFTEMYVPRFLSEIASNPSAIKKLAELGKRDKAGENIKLLCYCDDESLCHRSIVGGILMGAGCNVVMDTPNNDYLKYSVMFKKAFDEFVRTKTQQTEQTASKPVQGKPVFVSDAGLKSGSADTSAKPMTKPGKIASFKTAGFEFLSNMYPCRIEYDGRVYSSAEAVFQSFKTLSKEERDLFTTVDGKGARRLGKSISLRDDWDRVRVDIMRDVVRAKFTQNPELAAKLVATGNVELEEGTTLHDTFWGVDINTGKGQNQLGKILMDVRSELADESSGPDL